MPILAAPQAPTPSRKIVVVGSCLPDTGLLRRLGYVVLRRDDPADIEGDRLADTLAVVGGLSLSRLPGTDIILICDQMTVAARLAAASKEAAAILVEPVSETALLDTLERIEEQRTHGGIHVLAVDDDVVSLKTVAVILEHQGMRVSMATNARDALSAISVSRPDLLLLDLLMPEVDGIELARAIRYDEELADLPIVFHSAEDAIPRKPQALDLGADDYLQKPVVAAELVRLVRSRALRARRLRRLMTRDSLTGLLNHKTLLDELALELARASRNDQPLSFAMLDLDHFKEVNDTYGHQAGDTVIVTLGRQIRRRLRSTDRIGRYGGEEIGVVLPDTRVETASRVIDGIRKRFSRITEATGHRVTLSAGVAGCPPHVDPERLVEAADRLLYSAKRGGRNRVVSAAHPPPQAKRAPRPIPAMAAPAEAILVPPPQDADSPSR